MFDTLRPDLVIIFPSRKIIILELTVPFESNISDAHSHKTDRYSPFISDLKSSGYFPKFFTLEVGSSEAITQVLAPLGIRLSHPNSQKWHLLKGAKDSLSLDNQHGVVYTKL